MRAYDLTVLAGNKLHKHGNGTAKAYTDRVAYRSCELRYLNACSHNTHVNGVCIAMQNVLSTLSMAES